MKKASLLVLMLTVLSGCAESSALIKAGSSNLHSDVFREVSGTSPVPQGYADLTITSSLKTHSPGIYYSGKEVHGTPEYTMLVNIDGQAVVLKGELQKEVSEPRGIRDPEAGAGVRYRFSKEFRLKAGVHKIIVGLPDDTVASAGQFTLSELSSNRLVVEPGYGAVPGTRRLGGYGTTSFQEGVKRLRLSLNGQDLSD
jgi:hypothetical protein